jgi:hypothetical protein
MEVDTRGSERTNASVKDEQRETLATDRRIPREDNDDPSDDMEVEIDTGEKTNSNNQVKGKKINKRKRQPTK